jgi:hypothetical protein
MIATKGTRMRGITIFDNRRRDRAFELPATSIPSSMGKTTSLDHIGGPGAN